MIEYIIVGFMISLAVYTIISIWYFTIKFYKELEKDEDEIE